MKKNRLASTPMDAALDYLSDMDTKNLGIIQDQMLPTGRAPCARLRKSLIR